MIQGNQKYRKQKFPLIKLAKKLKGSTANSAAQEGWVFPLIKLAKKLKDHVKRSQRYGSWNSFH